MTTKTVLCLMTNEGSRFFWYFVCNQRVNGDLEEEDFEGKIL